LIETEESDVGEEPNVIADVLRSAGMCDRLVCADVNVGERLHDRFDTQSTIGRHFSRLPEVGPEIETDKRPDKVEQRD
jgi:hypothetical protein